MNLFWPARCAYDQKGLLLSTLAKTDGILGLSRSKVSLPSQLARKGIIKNVVGHCLTIDGGGGYLFLGDDFVPQWGMAWVPMPSGLSMWVNISREQHPPLPLSFPPLFLLALNMICLTYKETNISWQNTQIEVQSEGNHNFLYSLLIIFYLFFG